MKNSDDLSQFVTKTLKSWQDLAKYRRLSLMYRGHSLADWPLSTTFERCANRHQVKLEDRPKVEKELFREFRRAYHEYATHVPESNSVIEWLSLMQHYGAPTRLLDFTYSIYVATYFAVENATGESAVWAVDRLWAMKMSVASLQEARKNEQDIEKLQVKFEEGTEKIAKHLFLEKPFAKLACPLNAFRLNQRLRIQKGVFLSPGSVVTPFMQNLMAMPGYDKESNVFRLMIPSTLLEEIRAELYDMNITRRSLFPGLDGYAQALGVYHPVFNPDDPTRHSLPRPI